MSVLTRDRAGDARLLQTLPTPLIQGSGDLERRKRQRERLGRGLELRQQNLRQRRENGYVIRCVCHVTVM